MSPSADSKRRQAHELLHAFKGDSYVYGIDCFGRLGEQTAALGQRASVVTSGVGKPWGQPIHDATQAALAGAGVQIAGDPIPGASPNAPREDVLRIAQTLAEQEPAVVVAVGGGSGIDGTKAAAAYWVLGDKYPDLDSYFGVGQVTQMLEATGRQMPPLVAAQLASGSAAHLTKYSNVTHVQTAQKMLIVDEAVVPARPLFDYAMTRTMSRSFTMDGALDGIAHSLEVLMGASGDALDQVKPVSLLSIDLVVNHIKAACDDRDDLSAREALGLGTDLGGYAIMIGGTNGGHLTSFSLVDVLPHGRACALMNPYYLVFFAPAIEAKLRDVAAIYRAAGYIQTGLEALSGRDLGLAVAEGMMALSRDIGFPTTLSEVDGFTDAHIGRALAAAKNPKLDMKLKNMPVPLSADTVDDYMGPILQAAKCGDFGLIKSMV